MFSNMASQVLASCEAQLAGWKVGAEETLSLLLLGRTTLARHAVIVRIHTVLVFSHFDILQVLSGVCRSVRILPAYAVAHVHFTVRPCMRSRKRSRWQWLLTGHTSHETISCRCLCNILSHGDGLLGLCKCRGRFRSSRCILLEPLRSVCHSKRRIDCSKARHCALLSVVDCAVSDQITDLTALLRYSVNSATRESECIIKSCKILSISTAMQIAENGYGDR